MKKKTRDIIDCKRIEKMIPLYLEDKLSVNETKVILNHVNTCKNCKEELTIQYMVSEGLNKAEEDNDYNLLKGLDDKLEDSYRRIRTHDFLYVCFGFCIFCIVCIVILCVLFLLH